MEAMPLQALLDQVIHRDVLKPSRIGPMRTAIKQYAAILGVPPAACPPDVYHVPEARLARLIDDHAPPTLGPSGLRNLKNNLRFLFRTGVTLGLIPPLREMLQSWQDTRKLTTPHIPRHEGIRRDPYRLHPLPPTLAADIAHYLGWCASPFAPDRPSSIKKRPISQRNSYRALTQVAGFAVQVHGFPPEDLTLRQLVEPAMVQAFVAWWIERRGAVTRGIYITMGQLIVVARYWLKEEALADELTRIKGYLPPPEQVRDKRQHWLPLATLEAIGRSRYPLHAQRLLDTAYARKIRARLDDPQAHPELRGRPLRGTAFYVGVSLILRLLVRLPLRQRNIREMRLGRNLIRLPDGTWRITFRGAELKIAQRHGREHQVTYAFPPDLQELLEEWLTVWRPRLVKPADTHVFVTGRGTPFTVGDLYTLICRTTWKFSGVAVNPHLIRDIWATEYIKSTRDVVGAAYMLGDTVEIVLQHYAHLLDAEAEQRATAWLRTQLSDETSPPAATADARPLRAVVTVGS
jgi:Phage integrase family